MNKSPKELAELRLLVDNINSGNSYDLNLVYVYLSRLLALAECDTSIMLGREMNFSTKDEIVSVEPDNVLMFGKLISDMEKTYRNKNADYGNSFSESINRFGYIAAFVRMSDKFSRLENLLVKNNDAQVKSESATDSAMDLACYSVMLAMEIIKRNNSK